MNDRPSPQSDAESIALGVGRFYLGCAVWAFRGWLGNFYPRGNRAGDFLELYGDRFTAVEGNTTFYSVPDEATVLRWRDSVPCGFQFCPKLPRTISHQGALLPRVEEALAFLDRMTHLGDRLGPIFLQLPPSYSPNQLNDLQAFLQHWPTRTAPLAVEVRHPGWFDSSHARHLDRLLAQTSASRILLDTRPIYSGSDDPQAQSQRRKPQVPLQPHVTNSRAIVRFISHPDGDRNRVYLEEWGERVRQWLERGIDIFFFVHCPQEEHSPTFARQFQQRLETLEAPVPPLPWNELLQNEMTVWTGSDGVANQLSLF